MRTRTEQGGLLQRLVRRVPQRWGAAPHCVGIYAALLMLIPSQLIVQKLGSPGTPANLWALALLLWWVCATLSGQNHAGFSPARLAVVVLTLSVTLSYAWATATGWWAPLSVREATSDVFSLVVPTVPDITSAMSTAAGRGLMSFAGWMGIVLIVTDGIRSWTDLRRLTGWMSWIAGLVAFLGVVQFFTGIDIAGLYRIPGLSANSDFGAVGERSVLNRVSSTAVHPIEFGVVMGCMLPLALSYALHGNGDRRRRWIPAALIGLAIPMSVSRSAILAAGIAMIIVLVGWPSRRRNLALVIFPVAVVALRLLIPGLVGTIRSLFTNLFNDPSISGRTDDYSTIFALFGEHRWLGRGLFTFIPKYYRILDNQYLKGLLELGIVGLVATLLLFVLGYFAARGAKRRATDPAARDLSLALSGSIAGMALSYATFDAWSFPMAAGLTFLLIGMAGAAWRIAATEQGDAAVAAGRPRPVSVLSTPQRDDA